MDYVDMSRCTCVMKSTATLYMIRHINTSSCAKCSHHTIQVTVSSGDMNRLQPIIRIPVSTYTTTTTTTTTTVY
jgi:hypothetical protein